MHRPVNRAALTALLAGLVPILAAHAAYLVNVAAATGIAPEYICMPYLDGCVSISRAARSGPGLHLFRWLMLMSAVLLALCWLDLHSWLRRLAAGTRRRRNWIVLLGLIGSVFLVLYVMALGGDGEWYRWQRRYGVIFYFGGTALAQLLLVWVLWPVRHGPQRDRLRGATGTLTALVCLQWMLGVFSSIKRLLFRDPVLIDRLENIIEWWYALPMSLAFIVIAWLFRRAPPRRAGNP